MLLLPGVHFIQYWLKFSLSSFLQHGYVAEPMSQEEHDTIAQYLTICAYILNWSFKCVVSRRKCEISSANGGDKQNAWWLGGTDLHREVQSLPLEVYPTMTMLSGKNNLIRFYQSTISQGVWLWMSGAPWSFAPWGEGE